MYIKITVEDDGIQNEIKRGRNPVEECIIARNAMLNALIEFIEKTYDVAGRELNISSLRRLFQDCIEHFEEVELNIPDRWWKSEESTSDT